MICPFCNEIIVPYEIYSTEIDENFDLNIVDKDKGEINIMRKGKTNIRLLGCSECKKTFIEVKE